jgi:hypothetical protein
MPVIPPMPTLSTRQFFATVTAGTSGGTPCVICHYGLELNALGFSFEGFDEFGRARTMDDRGHPIDVGSLRIQNGRGAEAPFNGPIEFAAILTDNPSVQDCVARKFMGFARGLGGEDEAVDADGSVAAAWTAADLNLRTLFAAIVSSERFLAPAGGIADGGAGDAGPGSAPDAGPAPSTCDVPAILSQHACTGLCHAPGATSPSAGGGFDMMTAAWDKKLVGAGTPASAPDTNLCKGKGLNYLDKKQPATGLFLDKLRPNPPCGQSMPPVGAALSVAERACVQKWADALVAAEP